MSIDLLFIGNTEGGIWIFDRETEEAYSTFEEKGREFLGNSVTALDVHPIRYEYVVAGYMKGYLVVFDSTEP
jgi:hypothetical protein